MNSIIGVVVYLLITLTGGFAGLAALIRCYLNSKALNRQQILDEMHMEPAQNFSHDLTRLAGSRADDNRPECTICISELMEGEAIRVLSRCRHGFHAYCIEQWLLLDHNSCPTCRTNCRRILLPASLQQQQQLQLQQQQQQQQQQLEIELQVQEPAEHQQEPEQQLNDVVDDIESFFSAGNFSAGNCM